MANVPSVSHALSSACGDVSSYSHTALARMSEDMSASIFIAQFEQKEAEKAKRKLALLHIMNSGRVT